MYGLRTDYARNTNLSRASEPISVATFSGWFKFWAEGGTINVLSEDVGSDYFALLIDGKVYMPGPGASVTGGVQVLPAKLNQWVHLVIQKNGTEGKVYVNGDEQVGTLSGLKGTLDASNMIIGHNDGIANAKSYVSDFFFVDNHFLEPTAFGKSFEGKWGPLRQQQSLRQHCRRR